MTGASVPNGNTLFGITTRPYVLEQRGLSHYVGAQLQPYGLAALLPTRHLVDEFVGLDTWLGRTPAAMLRRDIAAQPDHASQAAALGAFVMDRALPFPPRRLRTCAPWCARSTSSVGLDGSLISRIACRSPRTRCTGCARPAWVSGPSSTWTWCATTTASEHSSRLPVMIPPPARAPARLLRPGARDEDVPGVHCVSPTVFAATLNGIARMMHGIDGAIMTREYRAQPTIVWIDVDDVDRALAAVQEAGGAQITDVNTIPGLARVVYVTDSEGNVVGLREPV